MSNFSRFLKFIRTPTARLALSYLAILLLLSIGFSVAVYGIATNPVQAIVQADGTPPHLLPGKSLPQPGKAIKLDNTALDRQVAAVKRSIAERLFILNGAVFVIGAGLCYYLARRTLKPIEEAMEAQARFASDASHELRTPLTVMQSETEGALRMLELPEGARAVFESTLEEIAQLKDLSEGLLRLARHTEAFPTEPVWIDEVIAKAKQSASKFAETKAITLDGAVPHTQAFADAPSLVQVISILLDNAMKYSPPKRTVFIEVSMDSKRAYTYISVRDQGIGIDRADLKRIFDRFYRSEHARKQSATGHGLGLSIAQKLVEQQHGRLTVESELSKGSTFTIRLPAFKQS
jgi:signal transduction histidine kinase